MNDFTKTDLREIYRCLKYMTTGGITPYSCHTLSLCKKLKSIIDNYPECKHEDDGHYYHKPRETNSGGIYFPIFKCKKCGEFYRERRVL